MPSTRFKIAAAVTLAALGLLAAVALGSGGQEIPQQAATPTAEVRTEVVRETVHRRERGATTAAAPAAVAPAQAAAAPAPAPATSRDDRSRHSLDDADDRDDDRYGREDDRDDDRYGREDDRDDDRHGREDDDDD